ncbi:MAG: radical SAM protein [Magnetococcales bacterium]|nr:radical SAM protein [Magnetococcales bacterium]
MVTFFQRWFLWSWSAHAGIFRHSQLLRRRLGLALDILKANLAERSRPYKLTFAVTNRCNSRCAICGIWQKPVDGKELTTQEIITFLTRNDRFSWIDLTGGEVAERPDAPDIVEAVMRHQRRLFHLHIPTNGLNHPAIMTLVRTVLLANPPLFTLTISLDGPPALHDRLRGCPGNWSACLRLFAELRPLCHAGFRMFFGFTLSHLNAGEFPATVRAAQEHLPGIDIHDFHINLAHRSAHYYGNTNREWPPLSREPYAHDLAWFRQHQRRFLDPIAFLERRFLRLAPVFLDHGNSPHPCQSLASSVFLDPTGQVYPCTIWDHPLGNIREHAYHLAPILAAARTTRERVRAGECPRCWSPCEAYPSLLVNRFTRER